MKLLSIEFKKFLRIDNGHVDRRQTNHLLQTPYFIQPYIHEPPLSRSLRLQAECGLFYWVMLRALHCQVRSSIHHNTDGWFNH